MTTVKADDRRRVQLPDIKPGQVFVLEAEAGKVTLTPVEKAAPETPKARLVKRAGRTYLSTGTEEKIDGRALQELLDEFP